MRQATSYKHTFGIGYPHRIHGPTTTSLATRITEALPSGLLKAMSLSNGNRLAIFFGHMAFVRLSFVGSFIITKTSLRHSWLRKNCSLVCAAITSSFTRAHVIYQVFNH